LNLCNRLGSVRFLLLNPIILKLPTDKDSAFDGILGLAFPSISLNPEAGTVFANLAREHKGEGVFAFYLADESDGELAIGGYNKDKVDGVINWVDLARVGYWLVSMEYVRFGDTIIAGEPTGGIMDTGTSLIYGPKVQVSRLQAFSDRRSAL
jgi:hypothetical protein